MWTWLGPSAGLSLNPPQGSLQSWRQNHHGGESESTVLSCKCDWLSCEHMNIRIRFLQTAAWIHHNSFMIQTFLFLMTVKSLFKHLPCLELKRIKLANVSSEIKWANINKWRVPATINCHKVQSQSSHQTMSHMLWYCCLSWKAKLACLLIWVNSSLM